MQDGDTAFLNVDVDVTSRIPLEPLVARLGRAVMINYVGREGRRYGAHFSLYIPRSADAAIRRLAKLIAGLPAPARRLWNEASERVFNVGFQSGYRPQSFETPISSAALVAAARLKASVTVTIYAVEEPSAPPSAGRQQRDEADEARAGTEETAGKR